MKTLRLGTRGSELAIAQADRVATLLRGLGHEVALVKIETSGDRLKGPISTEGGKALWLREIEQSLLEIQPGLPAAEPVQATVRADDPVAGDDDGDGVGAAGRADGAGGAVELVGELAVAQGAAPRDGAHALPDPALEGAPRRRQRQLEGRRVAVEVGLELAPRVAQHRGLALPRRPAPVEGDQGSVLLREGQVAHRAVERKLGHRAV